jgi:integrase
METMAKCPGVRSRKGTTHWWFRRRIPQDLLDHYHPKKETAFSLETSNYRKACEKARMEFVRLDQEFTEVRAKLAAEIRTEISDVEMDRLALMIEHHMLKADEEIRLSGSDDTTYEWWEQKHQERLTRYKRALARGDVSVVTDMLEDWLINHGISLERESERFKALAYRFLKIAVVTSEKQGRRFQGDVVEAPARPTGELFPEAVPALVPMSIDGSLKLSGLFEKWAAEKRVTRSENTVQDFWVYVHRFIELHGDLPVEQITKAHVRDYRDAMLKLPVINQLPHHYRSFTVQQLLELGDKQPDLQRLSPKTVNEKALGAVGAVLKWGAKNGYLDSNPAADMKISLSKSAPKARLPYSIDDLNTIFGSFPVFTAGERPKAGGGEAAKWLPLLALFTGARLQELGRLTTEDVKEERGVIFFDMVDAGTKTANARRTVPVHPELVRLGFMEYVDIRRREGGGALFPALQSAQDSPTENFTKWWGRYARKHGITDPKKVFHSFRHTAKDGFRNSGVPKEYRDLLQGHALPGAGELYGEGASLEVLAREMGKLCYPGLGLEHLMP